MTETTSLTADEIKQAPKVALHDHLDGGLRPQTVIELADACGYTGLPSRDAAKLGAWFRDAADSGSLPRYLETFDHTIAVMQTADALRRVAAETVEDLAADGVVYAETRFAPEQHLRAALTLDEVVEAVNAGCREGEERAAASGHFIKVGTLVTAMRQNIEPGHSLRIAQLAVRHRDSGVAGFDIAGPELGFGPDLHADAFKYLREQFFRFTIHAGEADGPSSIAQALLNGADRLGHGVRIIEDIALSDDDARLGRIAAYVRDKRIALEVCPSSNLQTGIAAKLEEHPIQKLYELDFNVTVNCDNRLMSGTSMFREFSLLAESFGWDLADLELVALNAIDAAFLAHDVRDAIADQIINGYSNLRGDEDED
ncbi:adenosine deaminase [Actinocrinis puniceicyclus]|uniref:adenosine deaminase n=1 Tax=Actinocrinis puniceicyclus TaxID=977794 RepID=A0A8J7WI65_9ACTN|nr:adenosine deaminase [Actinocrinis puniceicyclus]MBS2961758.1 adenosine deaminase [Actinocrinis puniceicyclus]